MPVADWAATINVQEEEQSMIELLNFIEAQCPNLKRLSLLSYHCEYSGLATTNSRLLDINNDLLKLDLKDGRGDQAPNSAKSFPYDRLAALLKERNNIDRKTQIHYEKMVKQENKDSISYWKGVEVVNCLLCRLRHLHGYPDVFIPILKSSVPYNDDGTLATLPEDTTDSAVELGNKLSLINSSNEMPGRIEDRIH
ncbi:6ad0f672-226e-48df-bac9-887648a6c043 [Sclerotinia trifoliorum]|uniref:6ad0f672-226e-48df-bac9-887648a6c043 n=1 Tax=Sclerotinia trifoliorum TaxID=28548 RepID=A0A8H2VL97_9HELO|nr:6ad0f672-226e-48df-bac9-887648a6c043 [Sclerotinia trifoliorum]